MLYVAALSYVLHSNITFSGFSISGSIVGNNFTASVIGYATSLSVISLSNVTTVGSINANYSIQAGAVIAFLESSVTLTFSNVVSQRTG